MQCKYLYMLRLHLWTCDRWWQTFDDSCLYHHLSWSDSWQVLLLLWRLRFSYCGHFLACNWRFWNDSRMEVTLLTCHLWCECLAMSSAVALPPVCSLCYCSGHSWPLLGCSWHPSEQTWHRGIKGCIDTDQGLSPSIRSVQETRRLVLGIFLL